MYIDTHCHLQFAHFDTDRNMIIGNAKKAHVKKFIVPGVDKRSNQDSILLSTNNPNTVFSSIGFHPYEAQSTPAHDAIAHLATLLSKHKESIVAIGECGLDYHQYKKENATSKKRIQKSLLFEQLLVAAEHHLPVILHVRDAYEDIFTLYDSVPEKPPGVIHCFSGGLQEMRMAKERGLFVGIDGNVTYSKTLQQILPEIPLAMMLLETDTPYLTPAPFRGERNEPKNIPLIASCVAKLLHTTVETVMAETTNNAIRLFKLSL